MNILITNDDGIYADGIIELAKAISKIANVYVVAPESQKSATGHAITIHNPIMVHKIDMGENIKSYAISGTPADCVKVGVEALFKEVNIDMVLSGINNGPNLGTDVIYSGTVAAAIEGLVEGKPSIALSCDSSKVSSDEYREAAKYTAKLIQKLEGNLDKLNGNILNVNFPTGEKKGVRITKLGRRVYNNVMDDRQSIRGQRYVWMGGDLEDIKQDKDSDIFAVENGYISITPVHINMTETNRIEELKELGLEE